MQEQNFTLFYFFILGKSSKHNSLEDSYEKSVLLKSDLNCNPISDLNLIFFPAFSFNIINNNEIDRTACMKLDMLKDKDTRADFSLAECTLLPADVVL